MNTTTTNCPICDSPLLQVTPSSIRQAYFYTCPVCGRFELEESDLNDIDENHLASYLCYHSYKKGKKSEYRYNTTLSKEVCDKYKEKFENGDHSNGRPVHIDSEIIESWYPKRFSERIDYILLFLNSCNKHVGQINVFTLLETISFLFIDRKEMNDFTNINEKRNISDLKEEARYILNYLKEKGYINFSSGVVNKDSWEIRIEPAGYSRIDEIQKTNSNGRDVLVAMRFHNDTTLLREAIRKGITDAGYHAVFIDEVQHNDFITPELLKWIRNSRFVVVDLTHKNNGAYFEEGYAMGQGKPVIQLCRKDTELHFDIKQKNTIIWETEKDIPERLTNRINATID